jgi:ActR/RegA family two-component response regulator
MFRFLFGLITGLGVGVVAGAMLAPSEREAREQAAGEGAGDLAPVARSPWEAFRRRLAEAARAGSEAAREMEEEMRARHRELVKRKK